MFALCIDVVSENEIAGKSLEQQHVIFMTYWFYHAVSASGHKICITTKSRGPNEETS